MVDPDKQSPSAGLSRLKTGKAAVAYGTLGDMILISMQDHALTPPSSTSGGLTKPLRRSGEANL